MGNNREYRRFDLGRFFVGLLIVATGLIYLGNNLGFLTVDPTLLWRSFWPLLIIALGLSLLSGKSLAALVIGFFSVLLVLGLIIGFTFNDRDLGAPVSRRFGFDAKLKKENVNVAKESAADSAEVNIKTGAGKLSIADGTESLVEGTFESSFLALETESQFSGGKQKVELATGAGKKLFGRKLNNLDLKLNSDLPLDLSIDSGAAEMNLDLRGVKAKKIDVETGASSLNLELGDKVEKTEVLIKAGASAIAVTLPKTVGAELAVSSGLSSRTLENFKQKEAGIYQSDNYAGAVKKIYLNLTLGASSLEVKWRE